MHKQSRTLFAVIAEPGDRAEAGVSVVLVQWHRIVLDDGKSRPRRLPHASLQPTHDLMLPTFGQALAAKPIRQPMTLSTSILSCGSWRSRWYLHHGQGVHTQMEPASPTGRNQLAILCNGAVFMHRMTNLPGLLTLLRALRKPPTRMSLRRTCFNGVMRACKPLMCVSSHAAAGEACLSTATTRVREVPSVFVGFRFRVSVGFRSFRYLGTSCRLSGTMPSGPAARACTWPPPAPGIQSWVGCREASWGYSMLTTYFCTSMRDTRTQRCPAPRAPFTP
eukprot:355048-Chlamydomonas_euryale.AAC.9